MSLVADVNAVGGQRKLSIEIQIADAVDLDAPDDGFGETGVLYFSDVAGRVLVKRAAAEEPMKKLETSTLSSFFSKKSGQ